MFSAIASPIAITIGTIFLTGGIAGAVVGGYGYIATIVFVPSGLPLFIVPQTANKHNVKKWKYEIIYLTALNDKKTVPFSVNVSHFLQNAENGTHYFLNLHKFALCYYQNTNNL